MKEELNYLDLFAGPGGLSEGFFRAGFKPLAYVESDIAASFTLRTRLAYHWLKNNQDTGFYVDYLNSLIKRNELYQLVPIEVIESVINAEIGKSSLGDIFQRIDNLLGKNSLNLIIGGPPCQPIPSRGVQRPEPDERRPTE
jgi:DNA (cytosine-5)-methyltransferase 1